MKRKGVATATLVLLMLTGCYSNDHEEDYRNDPDYQRYKKAEAEETDRANRAADDYERHQRDTSNSGYIDCDSFGSQNQAQKVFEDNGGLSYDPYWLDGDNDGVACE